MFIKILKTLSPSIYAFASLSLDPRGNFLSGMNLMKKDFPSFSRGCYTKESNPIVAIKIRSLFSFVNVHCGYSTFKKSIKFFILKRLRRHQQIEATIIG
jgi:hypothetical protein